MSLEDVGFRAFTAAVSDLFAMGAKPLAALSALTLPRNFPEADFLRLARGTRFASRTHGTPIAGGNMTAGPVLTVTTTVLGHAKRPLRRAASPGDCVYVLGMLGHARAGLIALERGKKGTALAASLRAFRRPTLPGPFSSRDASGAIDISDGLVQDLGHVARAARVGLVLDEEELLKMAEETGLGRAARALEESPLEMMLRGGEDYAVVLFGKKSPHGAARRIGAVVTGRGVLLRDAQGRSRKIAAGGFDHFVQAPRRSRP